jgi:hypothetical protein
MDHELDRLQEIGFPDEVWAKVHHNVRRGTQGTTMDTMRPYRPSSFQTRPFPFRVSADWTLVAPAVKLTAMIEISIATRDRIKRAGGLGWAGMLSPGT